MRARVCFIRQAIPTANLPTNRLREAGVAPDLVRLSVGIEDVDDIINDLQQALGE